MRFRTVNGVMAVLFAFAGAVQYNDPDPVRWILLYAAAATVSLVVAIRGTCPLAGPVILGGVALSWGLALISGVTNLRVYMSMFSAWEMSSLAVERARESSGLFMTAAWMAVLAVGQKGATHLRSRGS